jgi:Flp pilus assembly protein TadG
MRRTDQGSWTSEDGVAEIEFAFVAVLLVMVLLGVVEMGRMVLVYNAVANAAKAGARYAMVHGVDRTGSGVDGPSSASSYGQVQTVAQNYASAGLLNGSNVTVSVSYPNHSGTVAGNYPGDPVDVTVSYTYDPLVGYFSSLLNQTLSSTSEAVITY